MGIYNTYPTTINNHALPSPTSWTIRTQPIETVMVTESGGDVVDVTRADKMQIDARFRLAEGLTSDASIGQEVQTLRGFATETSPLTVSTYDPATGALATKSMRMRNFTAVLEKKSDLLAGVKGVWDISFSLIEF